ncbi:hypothetical protein GCM10027168_10540 [Streptomyces capparidis]
MGCRGRGDAGRRALTGNPIGAVPGEVTQARLSAGRAGVVTDPAEQARLSRSGPPSWMPLRDPVFRRGVGVR